MATFKFVPIVTWPRPFTKARRGSPFQSGYQQTIDLLTRELDHLSAKNVVLQLALSASDLRRDGLPRAQARPAHPGVIVSFEARGKDDKGGALSFPCDAFTDWESNLRAIALSLEALRKVDRYGVTSNKEQYRGWAALPAPGAGPAAGEALEAARFVARCAGVGADMAGEVLADGETMKYYYRIAAKLTHPDRMGDDGETFVQLQEAKDVLDRHHGEK